MKETYMNYVDIIETFARKKGLEMKELVYIVRAVMEVFPMVVLANLSRNTYMMIKHDNFLAGDIPAYGCYDDLIDFGIDNMHPNYLKNFAECFSRENVIRNYQSGMTEIYAELYQKGRDGKYQWVSTHAIRVQDDEGDIMHICLNRVLDGKIERGGGTRR